MAEIAFQSWTEAWPESLEGFTEIWVIGGDGTINYLINKYRQLDIPIALFSGGSGNDFAWKLYGDLSLDACFERFLLRNEKRIDVGICNQQLFINGVGVGFDGEVVKAMRRKRPFPKGHLAYLLVVLRKIFAFREKEMRLEGDLCSPASERMMVCVANGSRYGGGFLVAPQAQIDDGWLDLVLIAPMGLVHRLKYLPRIMKGKHLSLHLVRSERVREISVHSSGSLSAHLDGEYMEASHFHIRLSEHSLRFLS
jgi:YegS/Rv2252/BmrU family lipid kinase